jgi:aspartate aminotransferase, cytoplasmic
MLELVQQGAPDPMFTLKKIADADNDPRKVDLGVGVYRNEDGRYQELEVVRRVSIFAAVPSLFILC